MSETFTMHINRDALREGDAAIKQTFGREPILSRPLLDTPDLPEHAHGLGDRAQDYQSQKLGTIPRHVTLTVVNEQTPAAFLFGSLAGPRPPRWSTSAEWLCRARRERAAAGWQLATIR
jgi:hypothetical protein